MFNLNNPGQFNALREDDAFSDKINNNLDVAYQILFRAYYRVMLQMGIAVAEKTVALALSQNPAATNGLQKIFIDRFANKFKATNPLKVIPEEELISQGESTPQDHDIKIINSFDQALSGIKDESHKQILKNYLVLILATVRTNFFHQPLNAEDFLEVICFKFACKKILFLPSPQPLYEIFVYSPRVEGCHLRTSKISRGGIRWCETDRDYRYEILKLMATQDLKNAIIAPTGAKGGFVCKQYAKLKQGGATKENLAKENITRENITREIQACYQIFIKALLMLTDNIVNYKIVYSPLFYGYDEGDPYLVVAADKGTANFSDLANQIAAAQNFWLGDAFASGGSRGYNHRELGITSRGAWVAIQRHFYELGVDCNTNPITVVGVGDMSGDVFGNCLLMSQHLKLVAAFNQHFIFIDPNPNTVTSYRERQRLFQIAGSNWGDYNREIISTGGGVFLRGQESIKLTPEIQQLLGFDSNTQLASPSLLIQKILTATVDLLWFGGIGTFVKAAGELNANIHNQQNDAIRVEANQLQARVIGEGANLALTQAARVEYALNGGAINTDAIDNSAGVSCSDHEVNIKLLFCREKPDVKEDSEETKNLFNSKEQSALLRQCVGEILDLVLADNYAQTLLLSLEVYNGISDPKKPNNPKENLAKENLARENLEKDEELIVFLRQRVNLDFNSYPVNSGLINNDFGELPNKWQFDSRKNSYQPLTRPEKAVLVALVKNYLSGCFLKSLRIDSKIVNTKLPQSLYLLYEDYFPKAIRNLLKGNLDKHPLKLEIVSTLLANTVVNKMGLGWCIRTTVTHKTTEFAVVLWFLENWITKGYEEKWQEIAVKTLSPNPQPYYQQLRDLQQHFQQTEVVGYEDNLLSIPCH